MKSTPKRSPLDRSPPLRVAGQSLSEQFEDEAFDHIFAPAMLALLMIMMAALEWFRYFTAFKPNPEVFTGAAILAVAYAAIKIQRARKRLTQIKLGRDGERAVAEHLEWLRAMDFVVLHDIPNGDANVDHVLIGPQGIYTLETKTLSKPQRGACNITVQGGVIRANGQALDRDPLIQAKAQAHWLKNFFAESQFQVLVQPVVVFPGWFVEPFDMKQVGVWVLEIKALKSFISKQPMRHSHDQVKAMASALRSHVRSLAKK